MLLSFPPNVRSILSGLPDCYTIRRLQGKADGIRNFLNIPEIAANDRVVHICAMEWFHREHSFLPVIPAQSVVFGEGLSFPEIRAIQHISPQAGL